MIIEILFLICLLKKSKKKLQGFFGGFYTEYIISFYSLRAKITCVYSSPLSNH